MQSWGSAHEYCRRTRSKTVLPLKKKLIPGTEGRCSLDWPEADPKGVTAGDSRTSTDTRYRGGISESCKRVIRGGFAAMTPQQPEEWELRRKTAEGSPQGAAAGRRQVKVGRLQRAQAWRTRLLTCS